MREVGRRWHSQWDINVAARTKDWFAAIAASHTLALRDWSRPGAVFGQSKMQSLNAKVNRRRSRRRRAPTLANKMAKPWPVLASALNRQLGFYSLFYLTNGLKLH